MQGNQITHLDVPFQHIFGKLELLPKETSDAQFYEGA